jgi:CHASE2 domain-containing sensor protein
MPSLKSKFYKFFINIFSIFFVLVSSFYLGRFIHLFSQINRSAFEIVKLDQPDEQIVLVNIGDLNRGGIAQQIEMIAQNQPKVIGIQVCFNKNKPKPEDSLLLAVLEKYAPLIVMDGHGRPECNFCDKVNNTQTTVILDAKNYAGRWLSDTSKLTQSFEAKVVELFDKQKLNVLRFRNQTSELIYYEKDEQNFQIVSSMAVLEGKFEPDLFKDKIVLLAYLGADNQIYQARNLEVGYFTPLKSSASPAIIPSANIISNLLQQKLVDEVPAWRSWLVIAVILIINYLIYSFLQKFPYLAFVLIGFFLFLSECLLALYLIVVLLMEYQIMVYLPLLPYCLLGLWLFFLVKVGYGLIE